MIAVAFVRPASASGPGLEVKFSEGLVQNRNFAQDGMLSKQWVRLMPPSDAVWTQVVHVPTDWTDISPAKHSLFTISERNAPGVRALAFAMEGVVSPADSTLVRAGRVVAALQLVEARGGRFVARDERVWEIWELLAAEAGQADTLSTSFAALQVLRELGGAETCRLALYPVEERAAFGLLIDAPLAEGYGMAVAVSGGGSGASLFAVARSALPSTDLEAEDLVSWSWEEVLAPDWSPAMDPDPAPTVAPSTEETEETQITVCQQAELLGVKCESAQGDPKAMLALSAGLGLLLISWGGYAWRQRRARIRRVEAGKEAQRGREF